LEASEEAVHEVLNESFEGEGEWKWEYHNIIYFVNRFYSV
jgi:hypothetical protein